MPTPIRIAEVFMTLQGEATWTGTPSVFVRLMGCGVGCPWCDTRPTWVADPALRVAETRMTKLPMGPRLGTKGGPDPKADRMPWYDSTVESVMDLLKATAMRHVVITGGEPLEQPDAVLALVRALHRRKMQSQIETSGTMPFPDALVDEAPFITLSPKLGMPGGRQVLASSAALADEIKWPVGKAADLEALTDFLIGHEVPDHTPVWLQPLSQSEKATRICVDAALTNGRWRVSMQTHKYLGIP